MHIEMTTDKRNDGRRSTFRLTLYILEEYHSIENRLTKFMRTFFVG
jgi:hypothetical protein